MDFAERYGPWVIVAGASEGVGSAFSEAVARQGGNVVLLARRQHVLEDIANGIRSTCPDIQVRVLAVDLSARDAAASVIEATKDIDVGLLMYNAGADANYKPFLDSRAADALAMIQRNCVVPTELCHHYGAAMVKRGHGGIIIVSSGAAFAGAPNMVAYGATKAFDMVFAEALWSELHGHGVDVLSLVLGETDTPALRRLRAQRGHVDDPELPLAGVTTVNEVVTDALEHLHLGPSWMVGEQLREGATLLTGGMSRNDLVGVMVQMSQEAMG